MCTRFNQYFLRVLTQFAVFCYGAVKYPWEKSLLFMVWDTSAAASSKS